MTQFIKRGLIASLLLVFALGGVYIASDKAADAAKSEGVTHITQQQLAEKSKDPNTVLIDIRTQREVDAGAIPGSVHIPITKIMSDTSLLDEYKGKDLVFYCHTGVRVQRLTDFLQTTEHESKGFLHHLIGDWSAWEASGKPVK